MEVPHYRLKDDFLISLNKNLLQRVSTRAYHSSLLPTQQQVAHLKEVIKKLNAITEPFKRNVKLCLMENDVEYSKERRHPSGTKYWMYGVINKHDEESQKQFGYLFEILILECTRIGLQTVWIGVGFPKECFIELEYNHHKEFIPCVSPLGIITNEQEKIPTKIRKRHEWKHNFFYESSTAPLTNDLLKQTPFCEEIIKSIQYGPSAHNDQEWRVIITKQELHVFCQKSTWCLIDGGIAVAQTHVSSLSNSIHLEFQEKEQFARKTYSVPSNWEYIITATVKSN
ncbi:putative nitroreductase TM1586 domain-containing protein [Entamoeba marina]